MTSWPQALAKGAAAALVTPRARGRGAGCAAADRAGRAGGAGGPWPRRPGADARAGRGRHRVGRQDLDQGDAARGPGRAGQDPCRRGELQQPLGRAADAGADARRHRFRGDRDRHEPPRRDRAAGAAGAAGRGDDHHRRRRRIWRRSTASRASPAKRPSIFDGLEPGGTAVSTPTSTRRRSCWPRAARPGARAVTLRRGRDGRLAADRRHSSRDDATVVRATRAGRRRSCSRSRTPGRHFALNALGALAAADALGARPDDRRP